MAAEAALKKEAPAKGAPASTASKKARASKLPWVIVTVLLLGAGAGGAWYALKPEAAPATATAAENPAASAAAAAPAASKAAAIYYKFDPPFVVNFGGEGSTRYLQVTLEAMSRDAAILDVLKNNEPAVRNDLVLLFSSQDSTALLSADGKEKLRSETLTAIRKVLDSEGANGKLIEAVYFTSFVIQ